MQTLAQKRWWLKVHNTAKFKKRKREESKRYWLKYRDKIRAKANKKNAEKRQFYQYKISPPGTGWGTIRLKVLARDNCVCQKCGNDGLEVHHKDGSGSNKRRKEMNNKIENLMTVCHHCHIMLDLKRFRKGGFGKGQYREKIKRNKLILELFIKRKSISEIARLFFITRQRAHQLVKKYLSTF